MLCDVLIHVLQLFIFEPLIHIYYILFLVIIINLFHQNYFSQKDPPSHSTKNQFSNLNVILYCSRILFNYSIHFTNLRSPSIIEVWPREIRGSYYAHIILLFGKWKRWNESIGHSRNENRHAKQYSGDFDTCLNIKITKSDC